MLACETKKSFPLFASIPNDTFDAQQRACYLLQVHCELAWQHQRNSTC